MYYAMSELVDDVKYFRYEADDALPEVNSCKVCGTEKYNHAISYAEGVGYHNWIAPSNDLRLKRMKVRRELRENKTYKRIRNS